MLIEDNKLGIKKAKHIAFSLLFLHSSSIKNLVAVATTNRLMMKVNI